MKKRIIFVLITILTVSFSSTSYAGWKSLKHKAKDAVTKKEKAAPVVANEKKAAPVSKDIVLAKGLQISWCGNVVKDNGSITIPGLKDLTIPVKNGKFDLTVPVSPVFGDEWGLNQQSGFSELDFGTVKVYSFRIIYFSNGNSSKSREEKADGRGGLGFSIYYSEKDVKGSIDGKPAEFKKGWNIVGDKKDSEVSLMCAG